MQVSIIVAMTKDRIIGRNGALPWHLSADLRRFKRLTMNHSMIMGRKTYESIGRPLPGRTTIVLTRQANWALPSGVKQAARFGDALKLVDGEPPVFVVGGASIYLAALSHTDQIFRTLVHADMAGDTFFPEIDRRQWKIVEQTHRPADDQNQYDTTFQHLTRNVPGPGPATSLHFPVGCACPLL